MEYHHEHVPSIASSLANAQKQTAHQKAHKVLIRHTLTISYNMHTNG